MLIFCFTGVLTLMGVSIINAYEECYPSATIATCMIASAFLALIGLLKILFG